MLERDKACAAAALRRAPPHLLGFGGAWTRPESVGGMVICPELVGGMRTCPELAGGSAGAVTLDGGGWGTQGWAAPCLLSSWGHVDAP